MPHQLTVTSGVTGPNKTIAGQTILGVSRVEFDLNDKVLSVFTDPSIRTTAIEFDLASVAAVTFSIVTGNYSITIA